METSVFFSDVVYLIVGVPVTFICWVIYGYFSDIVMEKKFRILNTNLKLIQKRWAFHNDTITDIDDKEKYSFLRQSLILGYILAFFSWAGFLVSLVLWFYFPAAKSKKQVGILKSALANEVLSVERVTELIKD